MVKNLAQKLLQFGTGRYLVSWLANLTKVWNTIDLRINLLKLKMKVSEYILYAYMQWVNSWIRSGKGDLYLSLIKLIVLPFTLIVMLVALKVYKAF